MADANGAGAGPPSVAAAAGAAIVPAATAAPPALVSSMHGIVPTLQNIVATVNLDCKLDLKSIALHARNAEYNPKRFAAVIMRIRDPKTTALIFASGKMVCTGAKSEEAARLASRKYAKIVQKLGFPASFKDFKVQNIVGSADVRFPIRLEGLAYAHGYFCSYEPELFPGLIYRMKSPKVVLLIFVSGKVVLTGAKARDDIYAAFDAIYPVLQEFRKADAAPHPALTAAAAAAAATAAVAARAGGGGGAHDEAARRAANGGEGGSGAHLALAAAAAGGGGGGGGGTGGGAGGAAPQLPAGLGAPAARTRASAG